MIEDGILDLLFRPSIEVVRERQENIKALRKKRLSKNDAWLLGLPLADNFGNEKYPIINRGYLANLQMIINAIGTLKSKHVLDLGAGTCWTTNILAEKEAICVATDISREKYIGLSSADIFFKYRGTYFERVLSDMNRLPFKDHCFDIVFSNASVHHAQYLEGVFQESGRVLRDNGLLVLVNEPCGGVFKLSKRLDIAKAKERGMDVSEGWNDLFFIPIQECCPPIGS
jgi:SAM-dependent methyltransferase